ncbi:uncharacterized protein LOC116307525 [Actinia tenebrosa]|uniref:Uncharacterized protein LOC116307525 n=1 Tax=Actinia tenebrosa TaxID=6105 RepID=A0A6P8J282_ACTTE|nr:uncharacterized protein LOC116307525 [Actinia tenebrosa]
MALMVKRAAKKAIFNAKDGHGLLGLLIFDEKLVFENFRKLVESKENASMSLLKWSREEDNIALQDVFSKVFEVGSIWTAMMKEFTENHLKYRKAFKDVLREERELDELRKREMVYNTRLHKLQKQIEQNKRSNAASKPAKSSIDEMAEVLSKAEEAHAELEVKVTKHEIFKAKTLREALQLVAESIQTLAEQTLCVSKSYKQLADLIPDTPTQLTEEKVFKGAGKTRRIVTELSKEVGYEPVPASPGKNDQNYLYAVSPRPPDSCDTTGSPPKSPGFGEPKHRRSPPPAPVGRHRKISESSGLKTQHFSRPLSLENLRPPPSCPPPPLPSHEESASVKPTPVTRTNVRAQKGIKGQNLSKPQSMIDLRPQTAPKPRKVSNDQGNKWYARSKTIEGSDSEDSDGYTEPSEPYHKRSVSSVASDDSLRSPKINTSQYAECREESPWQQGNTYKALSQSHSEDQDDSQYVELFQ